MTRLQAFWLDVGQMFHYQLHRMPHWAECLFWRLWPGESFYVFRRRDIHRAFTDDVVPLFPEAKTS